MDVFVLLEHGEVVLWGNLFNKTGLDTHIVKLSSSSSSSMLVISQYKYNLNNAKK